MENLFFSLDFETHNSEQKVLMLRDAIDALKSSVSGLTLNTLKYQEAQQRLHHLSTKYPEVSGLIVEQVKKLTAEMASLQERQRRLNLSIDSERKLFMDLENQLARCERNLRLFGQSTSSIDSKSQQLKDTIALLEAELSAVNTDTEEGQERFLALTEEIDKATQAYKNFTDKAAMARNAVQRLRGDIRQLEQAQQAASKGSSTWNFLQDRLQEKRGRLAIAERIVHQEATSSTGSQNNASLSFPNLASPTLQNNLSSLLGQFRDLENTIGVSNGSAMTFMRSIGRLSAGLAVAAVAVSYLENLIMQLAEGAKEFETLKTALNTSLGNLYRTSEVMERIKRFASETPYEVKQLTDVFSRLASVNLQPTNAQLRAMGDLASSKNIPIEQLAEAIVDVSDVERWRNIGIQISNSGAKMTATFNGQTIVVNKTVQGAMKMIETFGNLAGVQGAMAAQSKTLAGMQSNLADSQAALANTIGEITMPAAKKWISLQKELYDVSNSLLSVFNQLSLEEQRAMEISQKASRENIVLLKNRLDIINNELASYKERTKFEVRDGNVVVQESFSWRRRSGQIVRVEDRIKELLDEQRIIEQEIGAKSRALRAIESKQAEINKLLNQLETAGYNLTYKEISLIQQRLDDMTPDLAREFQEFFIKTRENIIELQQAMVGVLPDGIRRLRGELSAELSSLLAQFDARRNELLTQAKQAGIISDSDISAGKLPDAIKEQLAIIDKIEDTKRKEQLQRYQLERERLIRDYKFYLQELRINTEQSEIDTHKALGSLTTERIIGLQRELDLRKNQLEQEKELQSAREEARRRATSSVEEAQLFSTLEQTILKKYEQKAVEITKKSALELQNYLNDLSSKYSSERISIYEDRIKSIQLELDKDTASLEQRVDMLGKIRALELTILEEKRKRIQSEAALIVDAEQRAAKLLELNRIDAEISQKRMGEISMGLDANTGKEAFQNLNDRVTAVSSMIASEARARGLLEQEAQLAYQARLLDGFRFNDIRAERAYQDELLKIRRASLEQEIALLREKQHAQIGIYGESSREVALTQSEINEKTIALGEIEIERTRRQREDWNKVISESYSLAKQAVSDYFTYAIQRADKDISLQEQRVERAARIAERGNAELLAREQSKLDKLQQEREAYVKAQQVLDLIEFGSKSIVAIANAAAAPFPVNLIAIPTTIAALIAGLAQVAALKGSISAFAEGTDAVPASSGNAAVASFFQPKDSRDTVLALLSPNEAVIQADIARKNPKTIRALRRGQFGDSDLERGYTVYSYDLFSERDTTSLLQDIYNALSSMQQQINVVTHHVHITQEGLYMATEREARKQRLISQLR